ncbi:DUF1598 domain-containing protein [Thalassoglobus sp. JC818]|uniref:DUF1598 domain-containing protein n=1 Tax=Thalassoglobus sp. JC818 TaxID=3232136 RepID=UPI003457A0E7
MMILETWNRRNHSMRVDRVFVAAMAFTCLTLTQVSAAEPNDVAGLLAAGELDASSQMVSDRDTNLESALQSALQGGTGADPDALINLILNQTEGPWQSVQGEGAADPEFFESGVRVDPNGVLTLSSHKDLTGNLAAMGVTSRVAALNEDMAQSSPLRLVSLTRLEKAVAQRLEEGKPVVESMKRLAGLSKIEYVFVYPESGEIVLGGPAEGWQYDEFGMAVGTDSGRPILHLDDFVTVLRTFSEDGTRIFGCSIDPRQENLKAVREFATASQQQGALSASRVNRWAQQIRNLLGLQDITVYGVPVDSRVARVLVEADYRMKLIGIGELEGGAEIPDYFELLREDPQFVSGGLDALRWWMTMQYESVLHSEDHDVYQIAGSAVKCQSENQFLADSGERVSTGQSEPVNRQFAENFTQHYAQLAQQDSIFADLQGIFDLALIAALIDRDELDHKAGWDRGVFASGGEYQPEVYAAPRQTESVVNHKVFNGRDIVLQVAGGVRADVVAALDSTQVAEDTSSLDTTAENAKAVDLPENRWWWDAK